MRPATPPSLIELSDLFEAIETFAHDRQQDRPLLGQHEMLRPPLQQLLAEQGFQADHVPAERALRDVQRLGGGGETQVLTDRIEGAQGVQRQPGTIDHGRILH